MWQINSQFNDDFHPNRQSSYYLKTDSNLSPYNIVYPIIWTGFINNTKIEIKQLSQSASEVDDFVWINFPEQYLNIQNLIVNSINNYLKKLN